MKQVSLDYTEGFSCLAGSCPDTCCKDWEIILDEDAISRYQKMPGVLGEQVRAAEAQTVEALQPVVSLYCKEVEHSEENLQLLQRVFEHGTISARYLYTVLRP